MRYGRITRGEEKAPRTKREHQNRAIATLEQEAQILDEVLVGSAQGRAIVAPPLKEKIEERLGKRVVLSTIYECWYAMVGVNSHQIPLILREMLRWVKIGEKIKE
jgi:hypothetical protein